MPMMKNELNVSGGRISVRIGGEVRISGMELVIGSVDGTIRAGTRGVKVRRAGTSSGADRIGRYRSVMLRLQEAGKGEGASSEGYLEVRLYSKLRVISGSVDVRSEIHDLLPQGSVRIEIGDLPGLKALIGQYMFSDWWSRPHFRRDLSKVPERTQCLLWRTRDGLYGCIVPLVDGGFKADINSRTGHLGIDLTSHDSGRRSCKAAAFVAGFGDDPYELVRRTYEAGMAFSGRPGALRWEKPYPEIFEYFGWCTWNAFYQDVNETGILRKLEAFKVEKFPLRWCIIDDGWMTSRDHHLEAFEPDRDKFPRGFKPLIDEVKGKYGLRWVGVWHTLTGYWRGIHPESRLLDRQRSNIFTAKNGGNIPAPDLQRGIGFWGAWHSWMRSQGIDFVKVDNQGAIYRYSRDLIPIGEAARGAQYALQASGALYLKGILNCMCMTSEAHWHWINSNVSRSSDDFYPKREGNFREHALQNVYNSLYYSNLTWPDFDMWWSHHPHGVNHAVLRAVSGGPVYVSDEVDKANWEVMWPLAFSDGRILRCDQPGLPTEDCLLRNPRSESVALKVWNRAGSSGIVAAFHIRDRGGVIRAYVSPSDVPGIEGKAFAVREHFSGEARIMRKDERWRFTLSDFGVKLFVIVPLEGDFAAIGLVNKYVSPKGITGIRRRAGSVEIDLHEGGDFSAYCGSPPKSVMCNGRRLRFDYRDGWLSLSCRSKRPVTLILNWK